MRNEAYLKDLILKELNAALESRKILHTPELATTLGIELYLLMYLSEDLIKNGYVNEVKTTSRGSGPFGSAVLRLTSKGKYFYEFGGYLKAYRKEKRNQYWQISKIVANILNAMLVLGIAAYGVKVQIDSNKKESESRTREEIREWTSLLINTLQSINKKETINDTVNKSPAVGINKMDK